MVTSTAPLARAAMVVSPNGKHPVGPPTQAWTWELWRPWLIEQGCRYDEAQDELKGWYGFCCRHEQVRGWWAANAYNDWSHRQGKKRDNRPIPNEKKHKEFPNELAAVAELAEMLGRRPSDRECRITVGIAEMQRLYNRYGSLKHVFAAAGVDHLRQQERSSSGFYLESEASADFAGITLYWEAPQPAVRSHGFYNAMTNSRRVA